MTKPGVKTTDFKKHPVYFQKGIHVDGMFAGVTPQWQKAVVIPGADCETVGDWAEETDGQFDVAAIGAGRVGSDAIRLTQTVAASDKSVYLLLANPEDLRWANYIGFWYRGGNNDAFTEGDIEIYIFTKPTSYLKASAYLSEDLFAGGFTEEAAAVWHYAELPLSAFTEVAANRGSALKEVWGIGFYSDAGANGNVLDIDHIEFYTHGTDYGPARGTIISAPIVDGITLSKGDGVRWEIGSGRVEVSANNDRNFAGICTKGGTGVEDGVGAWALVVGVWVWTSGVAEFVVDGPVNMLCSDGSIIAGESVGCSAVGTALTIDDPGGAAEADEFIGKALEAGVAVRVITVLLGVYGIVA